MLARFEAVHAELARVKEAAADMRLRLEHFTGPAGPQARMKQLEAALQSVSDHVLSWLRHRQSKNVDAGLQLY